MIPTDEQASTGFANRALLPLMVLVTRHKTMTLEPNELMRRFLLHVLSSSRRGRHVALLKCRSRRQSAVSQCTTAL
jgi:hypothetical protein